MALEEFGQVDQCADEDHGDNVLEEPPFTGLGAVYGL